ncbi:acyltransferase [Agrobacterium rhizogenes]|uniref:acyltransferase family protein n=1 Tax=Rhizobium rhizogenes TaxID=359 RepID=UPI0004D44CF2|nr:acyltransferase [Rhizobium rhizogenes]KAA6488757.1 acyltransferase [Agrobacterium sp. ICMP 7243]OCJ01638.1 exopolysaccharide biosynthesis protein [Agrobacterium sp. 13-626]KEA08692.1 exopolysaccharide biosynthesis protein [Rhizobium rhizogenes]MQB30602.1 acyltransferase [Rhizobium rhizogenes]NTF52387.1 acyltransferase [Rhizobium rhizogenes]
MKTLYSIQYLRAIAALAVVLFHAAERSGGHFQIGAAGVDVFFVISGFIMWTISERRPVTPWRFLFDRVQRIAPSYWIVTAIMIAGAVAGLFPNMKLTTGHILGSMIFIPERSPSNGMIWPVLVQGWTLNYEMFFYAIFGAALLLSRSIRLFSIASVFAAFVIAGVIFSPQSPLLLTYTRPIILEFVAGILLAELWLSGTIPRAGLGLALIVVALSGFAAIQLLHLEFNELTCGPLALALVLGTVSLERSGKLPDIPLLTYLGNASYSIYLWHTLAISVVMKLMARTELPSDVATFICLVSGVLLGICAYELVEKPLRGLLKGLSWQRSRPSPV